MSSKKAMKQAQKQAFAKYRSNLTNNRIVQRKNFLSKNKKSKENKNYFIIFFLFYQKKIKQL